jgi:hypothetical protein
VPYNESGRRRTVDQLNFRLHHHPSSTQSTAPWLNARGAQAISFEA